MTRARFWGSTLLAALAFAAAVALLFPYGTLGIARGAERERVWLLTLWCAGVLALLFGLSAALGGARGLGVREVQEAGSVAGARDRLRRADTRSGPARAWWPVLTGGWMVAIYFAGWLLLR